jgi:hypothetical protein
MRILKRDVEEAELLELLCARQRPDVERPQATVGDELRYLPFRFLIVGRRRLACGDAGGHLDLQNLEPQPTFRCIDGSDVATPATEQRASERRRSRDATSERVCLVRTDELIPNLLIVLEVAEAHLFANVEHAVFCIGIDDLCVSDPLLQDRDPPFEQGLLLARVVVIAVLDYVALARDGVADSLRNLLTANSCEVLEFLP